MARGQVAESHSRSDRMPGLVADPVLGVGRGISGSIQARNRSSPVVDNLPVTVSQESA